jgi:hypothetical protein
MQATCSSSANTDSSVQTAAVDLAASASRAARAAEPASPEDAVVASEVELAAYGAGTLAYLAQGCDLKALDLAKHVRVPLPDPPHIACLSGSSACMQ